ncbi:hypothetical protein PspLS_06878 [Pyricularia sp. CBS 133598]|nr:hypothetical protein PspLS_06878 [Pyricularia sp. CBS 133598]
MGSLTSVRGDRAAADPAEEDAFRNKMRMLGASWHRDEYEYDMSLFDPGGDAEEMSASLVRRLVWEFLALRAGVIRASDLGFARIRNAFTVEEMCRQIEKLGSTFYEDPTQCPCLDLAKK